ncbi:hypothetical protein F4557_002528 [Actinomadura catellatispora]|uniref:Uncharacterized protein n=1 Tax=Actinomadura livida TaxID=79909 RepID=A0A7W7MXT6_9ACTN|nr:hypothetical protein [Actinomadura catellatispora]
MRSYISSAGVYSLRWPSGDDVSCGIDIPVMSCSAEFTYPLSARQRYRPGRVAALAAELGGRKPAIDQDQCPAIPFSLVLEHPAEFAPSGIRDGAGKTVILHQTANREILDRDRLVLADESSGELVQKVAALISDLSMRSGYSQLSFSLVRRPWKFASEVSLDPGESESGATLRPGIGNLLSRRECCERGDSNVHSHRSPCRGQLRDRVLAKQGHEPAARTVPGHGHCGRRGIDRQRARPHHTQRGPHFGQLQMPVMIREPTAGIFGGLPRPLPGFEYGIPCAPGEEVGEGSLKMSQCLLQRNRRPLCQELKAWSAFPLSEQSRGLRVRDLASFASVGACALLQGFVVNESDASEGPGKLRGLLGGGIEAVLEAPLHLSRHGVHGNRLTTERRVVSACSDRVLQVLATAETAATTV